MKFQFNRNSYQNFEISPSSTKHKPNSSRFNIPQSSTLKNGGMMVINNFNSIPKTEVAVRVKLRNNQYSNKKGFVE
jgi:translation initiation factor 2 beta subunit (eIF-2beta)/eIF-5